jgi:extradiol dioxygenase family protein
MSEPVQFHHALPVEDLDQTRAFYGSVLGCAELQRGDPDRSLGFDFFGHEIVLHAVGPEAAAVHRRASEGANAAIRHFGVYLPRARWELIVERIANAGVTAFGPVERGNGAFVLVADPSANVIEFKTTTPAPQAPTTAVGARGASEGT